MSQLDLNDAAPFEKLQDPTILLPLLEQRLPVSSFMYNAVKMHSRYPEQGGIYILNGDISESAWIIATHYREDDGQGYHLSADKDKSKLSREEVIQVFSESKLFNWDGAFFFAAIEPWISDIVHEISVKIKGNFTLTIPCHHFVKDIEDCIDLDVRSNDPDVELRPLDLEKGLHFLMQSYQDGDVAASEKVWRRFITANESCGVYLNGEIVCGLVTRGFGILGTLSTLDAHRRKGYAGLAMKYAFKALASNGIIPSTTVVRQNTPSIKLHQKLGCKNAGMVEYVEVLKRFLNAT